MRNYIWITERQRDHLLQSSFIQFMKQQIKAEMCLADSGNANRPFIIASNRNHRALRDSRIKAVQLVWVKIIDAYLKEMNRLQKVFAFPNSEMLCFFLLCK